MRKAVSLSLSNYGLLNAPLTMQVGPLTFISSALPFNMQAQTQSNWCWAATSTSVSSFYWSSSTWTQCLVANGELGHSDCCSSPVHSACNVSWYLDRALQRTSNLDRMISGAVSFQDIKAQIDSGKVIGIRIEWAGGGGHFLCICGYAQAGSSQYADVDDPIYGKSHVLLSMLSSQYQGSGTWTHTYITKRWSPLNIALPNISADVIRKIREYQPLLALKRGEHNLQSAATSDQILALPHNVYVANLSDLATGKDRPLSSSAKPAYQRVFQLAEGQFVAQFDLLLSAPLEIANVSQDHDTIELLQKSALAAEQIAGNKKEAAELRFLRVPALYVEAFWLHYADEANDIFIPIRGIGLFTGAEAVPIEQFRSIIVEAAAARIAGPQDDLLAP